MLAARCWRISLFFIYYFFFTPFRRHWYDGLAIAFHFSMLMPFRWYYAIISLTPWRWLPLLPIFDIIIAVITPPLMTLITIFADAMLLSFIDDVIDIDYWYIPCYIIAAYLHYCRLRHTLTLITLMAESDSHDASAAIISPALPLLLPCRHAPATFSRLRQRCCRCRHFRRHAAITLILILIIFIDAAVMLPSCWLHWCFRLLRWCWCCYAITRHAFRYRRCWYCCWCFSPLLPGALRHATLLFRYIRHFRCCCFSPLMILLLPLCCRLFSLLLMVSPVRYNEQPPSPTIQLINMIFIFVDCFADMRFRLGLLMIFWSSRHVTAIFDIVSLSPCCRFIRLTLLLRAAAPLFPPCFYVCLRRLIFFSPPFSPAFYGYFFFADYAADYAIFFMIFFCADAISPPPLYAMPLIFTPFLLMILFALRFFDYFISQYFISLTLIYSLFYAYWYYCFAYFFAIYDYAMPHYYCFMITFTLIFTVVLLFHYWYYYCYITLLLYYISALFHYAIFIIHIMLNAAFRRFRHCWYASYAESFSPWLFYISSYFAPFLLLLRFMLIIILFSDIDIFILLFIAFSLCRLLLLPCHFLIILRFSLPLFISLIYAATICHGFFFRFIIAIYIISRHYAIRTLIFSYFRHFRCFRFYFISLLLRHYFFSMPLSRIFFDSFLYWFSLFLRHITLMIIYWYAISPRHYYAAYYFRHFATFSRCWLPLMLSFRDLWLPFLIHCASLRRAIIDDYFLFSLFMMRHWLLYIDWPFSDYWCIIDIIDYITFIGFIIIFILHIYYAIIILHYYYFDSPLHMLLTLLPLHYYWLVYLMLYIYDDIILLLFILIIYIIMMPCHYYYLLFLMPLLLLLLMDYLFTLDIIITLLWYYYLLYYLLYYYLLFIYLFTLLILLHYYYAISLSLLILFIILLYFIYYYYYLLLLISTIDIDIIIIAYFHYYYITIFIID